MNFLLNTPGDRLNAVITWASKVAKICYNQKDLATRLGYNPCYLSALKSGVYDMNDLFLQELKQFEPRINTDWIITGVGEMLTKGNTIAPPAEVLVGSNFETLDKQQEWRVPNIPHAHIWARITNLSMAPRFYVEDVVAGKRIDVPKVSNIYLIKTLTSAFVGRLTLDAGAFVFSFDNAERFPRVELTKDAIKEIYQIVGLIRADI